MAYHGPWWVYPLLMCLVLTGIHGYLGIHVLKRKVIFVDLAMAQIAALGAAYAILLGYDPKHPENEFPIYLFSLGFTLAGAAVISLSRMKKERVPHEAFIGIVYASASALAMLLLSKSPTEGEQIKHMLVGSLLTVQPKKVWSTAAIYSVIGAFHWHFRRKFFAISDDAEAAEGAGISVRFWDFLFYVSFGFVITSSVSIAGVLLVFSFLVVPGVIAVMFADGNQARITIAWSVGTVVSMLGMFISNQGDFPTGPSIVAAFTATLIVSGIVHYLTAHEHSGVAARRLLAGGAIVALLVWGTTFLKKHDDHEHGPEDPVQRILEALKSDNDTQVLQALDHVRDMKDRDLHFVAPILEIVRRTKSDQVLEHSADVLAKLDAPEAAGVLKEAAARDLDADLQVHLARAVLDLRDPGGFALLVKILESGPPEFARKEALQLIQERTGLKLEGAALKKWLAERGPSLKWKSENKRFE
ncbi:MAG: metal ABC transporter permease [Planctomycetes bacterium]|nr:metal ABC transporter permease [Planctomycetota bacterium]